MQNGNTPFLNPIEPQDVCAFCQSYELADNVLKETTLYRLVADFAPLVEGHLLIIPKTHYACYGAVPTALDAELFALKQEVQNFFARYYAPSIFWEHGVFHQTVFHAHLHCFPFGDLHYDTALNIHEQIVRTQDDIRAWYDTHGHYFYLHDSTQAYLFAPNSAVYQQVARGVLWAGVTASYGGHVGWRSSQQRQVQGMPLIEATKARWQQFQQAQGVVNANETSTR